MKLKILQDITLLRKNFSQMNQISLVFQNHS